MADPRTHIYANNAQSFVAVLFVDSATTLTVVDGSDFPSPGVDEIAKIVLENPTTGDREICNCTARSGNDLTVERAQEGTTAIEWAVNTVVAHRNTAETMEHLEETGGSIFDGDAYDVPYTGDVPAVTNVGDALDALQASSGGGGGGAVSSILIVSLTGNTQGTISPGSQNGHNDFTAGGNVVGDDVSWIEADQNFAFASDGLYRVSVRAKIDCGIGLWPQDLTTYGVIVRGNLAGKHARTDNSAGWFGSDDIGVQMWQDEAFVSVSASNTITIRVYAQNYFNNPSFDYSAVVTIEKITAANNL